MSARMEKVREALRWNTTGLRLPALAEVEEWETRLAEYGERIDGWRDGEEYRRLYSRAEAAEADLNETRSLLLKATDDRRLRAAEARIVELEAALRNPGGTDL